MAAQASLLRMNSAHLVRAALATAGAVAIGIAFTGLFWLPGQGQRLEARRHAITQQLHSLENTARQHSPRAATPPPVAFGALPEATAFSLTVRDVLAMAGSRGATGLNYAFGSRQTIDGVITQPVHVSFSAGVAPVGDIFRELQRMAPHVRIDEVQMERDRGGIAVLIAMTLLGTA